MDKETKGAIRNEMDGVIDSLESSGVTADSTDDTLTGLGDIVADALAAAGITEERFQQWFGLKECGCTKRKEYLNKLFSWRRKAK
jgi:hypothetical protein